MKHSLKIAVAAIMVLAISLPVRAYEPTKTYMVGDTIILDDIVCVIFNVDDYGLHGKAMSPYARKVKDLQKDSKKVQQRYEKEIAKGNATQDELDIWLKHYKACEQLIKIPTEKGKKGKIFRVDKLTESMPEGWRVPTAEDAKDFATFYYGGLGKKNSLGFKFVQKANELVPDPLARQNIQYVAFYGMIISDSDDPSDVKFVQRFIQKITGKTWLEIKEKFAGQEKTVAVKDF